MANVLEFRWSTPASWGGKTFETYGGQISINYNETSGDGEKITVTPKVDTEHTEKLPVLP